MREIIFRGMDEHSNWVHGGFYIGATGNSIIAELGGIPPTWSEPGGDCRVNFVAVDSKTVGQFIGLKDKNGVEIYEGDIVKLVHRKSEKGGWYSNKKEVGEVFFDLKWGAKFNCKDLTQRVSQHWKSELNCFSDASDVVVIGNIHQNPELLSCK